MPNADSNLVTSIKRSVTLLIGLGCTVITLWSALNHYYGSFQGGIAWLNTSQGAVRELQYQETAQLMHHAEGLQQAPNVALRPREIALSCDKVGDSWRVTSLRGGPDHSALTGHQAKETTPTLSSQEEQSLRDLITRWVNDHQRSLIAGRSSGSYIRRQSGMIYQIVVHHQEGRMSIVMRPLDQARLRFLERVTATELILVNQQGEVDETTFSCQGECTPRFTGGSKLRLEALKESKHLKLELPTPYLGAYEQFHVGDRSLNAFMDAIPLKSQAGEEVGSLWVVIPEDVMLYWPKRGVIGVVVLSLLIFTLLIRRLTRITRQRLAPIAQMIEEVDALTKGLTKDHKESDLEYDETRDEVEKLRDMFRVLSAQLEANKRLSQQLQQSQKMEVIGTLAGGVAHDFNNLMSVILFNSECLQESFEELTQDNAESLSEVSVSQSDRAEWLELVQEMLTACGQAKTLTQQLLSISRDQRGKEKAFSVIECVSEVRSLSRRLISEEVRLNVSMSEFELWGYGNENNFKQALMNVIINARDSLDGSGLLSLSVTKHQQAQEELVTAGVLRPADYVSFKVEDTGGGIPPQNIEHLFTPFFSSKGSKGTGLGLTIVYNTIIERMQGAIRVDSTLGEGSSFELFIPSVAPLRESLKPTFSVSESQVSAERIVVIEDHDVVRRTLANTLKGLGFKVYDFPSGVEFIQWFEQNSARIDLVLSDVVMPDMSGPEVWKIIKESHPDLPFLFLTGYTGEAISRYSVPPELILSKPISTQELKEKLLEMLGTTHGFAKK